MGKLQSDQEDKLPFYVVGGSTIAMFVVPSLVLALVCLFALWTVSPILIVLSPVWVPALGAISLCALIAVALLFIFRSRIPAMWAFCRSYLFFLAPFYGVITIAVAAVFSFWWSLAIGACLFIQGEVLLDRTWAGKSARWPAVVSLFDTLAQPLFDYFPITLEKTDDLSPERQYIFGYHPHGIYAFGAFSLMFQKTSGFESIFRRSNGVLVGVASALLHLPLIGTLCMWFGFIPASFNSLQKACDSTHDVVIIPGGIAEVVTPQQEDEDTLFLREREGFIKLAMMSGRDLVPVFGFGESQTFTQFPFANDIRQAVSRRLKIIITPFHGRWFTLMPYNVPIRVVTGRPIPVPHIEEPTPSDIQDVLEAYIAELERVYELYKESTPGYEQRTLRII